MFDASLTLKHAFTQYSIYYGTNWNTFLAIFVLDFFWLNFLLLFIIFFFLLNVKIRFPLLPWKLQCSISCITPVTETLDMILFHWLAKMWTSPWKNIILNLKMFLLRARLFYFQDVHSFRNAIYIVQFSSVWKGLKPQFIFNSNINKRNAT